MIDQVMKDSSCHDPKMEAYCKEVWCLEDKFHGLELNHIAHRYNEATDELVKIASSRTMVPPDVFLRDFMNLPLTSERQRGSIVYHSTPHLRQRLPQPRLTSCKRKARLHQPTSSPTGVFRTSTVSFEGSSLWIRPRLDGSLVGPKSL
jgi:hypothetical protein